MLFGLASIFILLTACGAKQAPVLRIGTNAEYPPFESKDGEVYIGVDIDLARKIAEKLDMDFQIVDIEFDNLLPSLASKTIDMAISAITITDARKRLVDFSTPYYLANQVIITKADSPLTLDKPEDATQFKVGALNGSTGQIFMTEKFVDTKLMPKDKLFKYPTNLEAITDLLNGNIDFVIIDDSAAQGFSRTKPISVVLKIETNESYGIAMPKGSPLNAKIDAALRDLIDSGEVASILQTHIR